MHLTHKEHRFNGRLLIVGFGCIGQGVLPLLLHHIDMQPGQITLLSASDAGAEVARSHDVVLRVAPLTESNHVAILTPLLGPGDFLLNLSVDVSSAALIAFCQALGALYLDTCIEPWAGGYRDTSLPIHQRTNYALREQALALRAPGRCAPTAVLTHGANPGLVSHLLKQALLDLAQAEGMPAAPDTDAQTWARLAKALGVRVIHIAERDTQAGTQRKRPGEFVNTWSVDGFIGEGCQPAELGWGSHERHFPADGQRHASGSQAAIYLQRPGAGTRVRSWTPLAGPQLAFLITHGESISMADHLTLGDLACPDYRPTVLYAYHPCDDAVLSLHELAGRHWQPQPAQRILKDEIASGMDGLGVLLMGHAHGAYWYGSRLSIEQARALCPNNSATSLQVTAAVMAGVVWAMRHPMEGVVEPDDLPHTDILALCRPYLGDLVGVFTDWTPLAERSALFDETPDLDDPWQFGNFRVD
jgi:homospermidine synthase